MNERRSWRERPKEPPPAGILAGIDHGFLLTTVAICGPPRCPQKLFRGDGHRDELVSSVTIPDIHSGDIDQYRRFLAQVQTEELGRRADFQCVTKAGEPKACEISIASADFDDDQYLIAVIRDISGRKEHEQQLKQFASTVSHDLRNPLQIAEGHLELVKEECSSKHLETIEDAHERMRTLNRGCTDIRAG